MNLIIVIYHGTPKFNYNIYQNDAGAFLEFLGFNPKSMREVSNYELSLQKLYRNAVD